MKKKKTLALAAAAALACCCVAGGSLSWLWDRTEPLDNVFTVGHVAIELEESTGTSYKMIPGCTIGKDPTVTVKAGSEDCWLFVRVEKSEGFDNYMACVLDDQWKELTSHPGVYYRQVPKAGTDQKFSVLKDDQITVRDTVTEEAMAAAGNPTLTFTAYAVQYYNGEDEHGNPTAFDAEDAWAQVAP